MNWIVITILFWIGLLAIPYFFMDKPIEGAALACGAFFVWTWCNFKEKFE